MGRTRIPLLALLALFSFAVARPAAAVVIASGDGTGNTTAPNDDPGWNNVGVLGAASAVYLGNRWVLTAAHVSPPADDQIVFDGKSYTIDVNSAQSITNPTGFNLTTNTDLVLFELTTDPGLPSLTIATNSLSLGTLVTMIGAGSTRDPNQVFWDRTGTPGTATITWTPSGIGQSNAQGYFVTGDKTMRWGLNFISSGLANVSTAQGDLLTLSTTFSATPTIPFEAQAASGDSGGGVFSKVNGSWQLSGIIDSIQPQPDQPSNTAVFGNLTYLADLSQYRSQITTIMKNGLTPYQNPINRFDVNADGTVTADDALALIDALNSGEDGPVPPDYNGTSIYVDVNGDNVLSAADVLAVINELNATTTSTILPSITGAIDVPEPSSFALAAVAFAGLAVLGGRRVLGRKA